MRTSSFLTGRVDATPQETTEAARLRLAYEFLSRISLTTPPAVSSGASSGFGSCSGPRSGSASTSGPDTFTAASPRNAVELERRSTDVPSAGASWLAVAALDFLTSLSLTGSVTGAGDIDEQNARCQVGSRSGLGDLSVDGHLQKDGAGEGTPAPPSSVEARLGEAPVAARRVLTFARMRELREADLSATNAANRTRVLVRTSAFGAPCLALSVIPFEREYDETIRKGVTDVADVTDVTIVTTTRRFEEVLQTLQTVL